jgi:predicted SAM-dependent methyltransferase
MPLEKVLVRFRRLVKLLAPPVLLLLYFKLRRVKWLFKAKRQLHGHTRLHLGCGRNIRRGWANIDRGGTNEVIKWDLTWPLPVESGVTQFIYCEHFIEHINRDQARAMLKECYRVLSPGGVLRISTPNLRALTERYLSRKKIDFGSPCRMMNQRMRLWGHQFVYDLEELETLLMECGFRQLTPVAWRESDHVELKDLEYRPFDEEIIMEATK